MIISMATRRSFGLSLLSFGFLWLTVAAFAYANRVVANPSQLVQLGVRPRVVTALAVASGIAAASVTIAAWMRSRWLAGTIVFWGVSVGAVMAAFQTGMGSQGEPLWLILFPYAVLGILTWGLVAFANGRV